jgi:3-oxoacyl-[acyl-carrier-protein] synthase II
VVAAAEAWADSGLADSGLDKERLGVAVASGIGGLHTTLRTTTPLRATRAGCRRWRSRC